MITISFLAIVKNEEKYIAELLRSILVFDNDFFSYEIVIIDDHSIDDTYHIVRNFQDTNLNIKYFKNSEKGKVAGTFFGINQCRYEWIKFVDGDDYLDLGALEPGFFVGDVIYHDYCTVTGDTLRLQSSKIKDPMSFIKKGRSLPKGMFFCKKSVLTAKFPPPNDMLFEDFWINFVCLTNNSSFYLNQPVYFYRQHGDNYYGSNDGFTREKMKRMGNRYLNVVPKIALEYEFSFDKNLIRYAKALADPNFVNWIKLLPSPYYLLKFWFYFFKAKVN